MRANPSRQVASVLDRFGARLAYATDYATAAALVAEIIADANGGLVAIDLETAPTPSEQKRLWALRLQLADVVGRLNALTRLKTSRQRAALQAGRTVATLEAVELIAADLAEAKAQKTALTKAAEHAARAGLDPHRSEISLVQIYAGGGRVAAGRLGVQTFPLRVCPAASRRLKLFSET